MATFAINNQNRSLISFNQWTNKKYAVFNSLKRIIKIASLSVAYSIIAIPELSIAQTDSSGVVKNLDLEEVVVSAERSPVVFSRIARVVTVITDKDAQGLPGNSLNELIERSSFVDIRQRGTNGIQADISIRGGTFDQNLVLLNGINITDPQTGHHSLNLPIDLNAVQRIEILEGSGSRVFGPNAFSGAINIITPKSEKSFIKTSFSAGDFGYFKSSISGSILGKQLGQFVSATRSVSGGFAPNTDFNNLSFFYNPYINSSFGSFDFQVGYIDKAFGANSFYTPEYPNQYEQIKSTIASLKFETGTTFKIIPIVYYREHKDRFELFRNYPAIWYTGHNYHFTQVYGAKIDARAMWQLGTTSAGIEYRSENILSNKLGNTLIDTLFIKNEPDGFYNKKYSRTISNLFFEHSFYYNSFSVTAGILGSFLNNSINNLSLYPGIDLAYEVNSYVRIYSSVNKSLRLPTFTDLFYSGPKNIGNSDLVPEEAWGYECGLKYNEKVVNSGISIFYRDAKNLIEWVKHKDSLITSKWETQNLTDVNTYGLQLYVKIKIEEIWTKQPVKLLRLNYSFIDQYIISSEFITKYSLNHLKHNFNASILHSIYSPITMSWSFKYQERAGNYQPYNLLTNTYESEKAFSPSFIVDAKIYYQKKWLSCFVEVNNLLNNKSVDFGNIEMPGRWFFAGIELKFGSPDK